MPKNDKTSFVCGECGYESVRWTGKCPQCGSWNTMVEFREAPLAPGKTGVRQKAQKLGEIAALPQSRVSTGIRELDRVLGGGLIRGMVVLLGGDPGIGKSTLLMQACANLAGDARVLYVSGEESAAQIRLRADRLGVKNEFHVLCENDLENALNEAADVGADVIVADSIQTMADGEANGVPGSVNQVRAATARLTRYAKETGAAVLIVGHVTRDGNIAGPKVLEHIVDTVLYFEGDRHEGLRLLRAVKNRFGSTNEVGVFEMTDTGMEEVPDPSRLFLSGERASGCAVTCALEGSRPLLAEIQSLLTENAYGNPRRISAGMDTGRLCLLLAVLEKKARLKVSDKDVYLNVVGGLRLDERSVDLAAALCVASALTDVPLPEKTAALGEIGLTGEIRGVPRLDARLAECYRLGYTTVLVPKGSRQPKTEGLRTVPVGTLMDAIAFVLHGRESRA